MNREDRIHLAGLVIRKSLALQGFADAIVATGDFGTFGERLKYQVKMLRFGGRDVASHKLEPYDLGAMVANVRDTVLKLSREGLSELYAQPLLAECTQLEDELKAAGAIPH